MLHTVLIVEDEDELRESMRDALEFNGYAVVAAQEGQEALDELVRIEHVCVVLLDLLMPGMNGWEFYDKLRARPEYHDVPVVIHTSAPSRAPVGVTRILSKPLEITRLLSVVREYCVQ
jgi:CheY-like chemotaxis protein